MSDGKALYLFHAILIACGILYCFGFAFYQWGRSTGEAEAWLPWFFAAAGVGLSLYLRSVVSRFLRRGPQK